MRVSGGAIAGLIAAVAFGLVVAAAFFWFMPRDENPGPLDTLWGFGLRGTPEVDVARELRRAREAAERAKLEGSESGEPLPEGSAASGEEPAPARYEHDEGGWSGRR
jgi:hypothetical protein